MNQHILSPDIHLHMALLVT